MSEVLDLEARYAVRGFPGVAFWLHGYGEVAVYEGDYLVCDDDECDHDISETCWAEGDWSLETDHSRVRATMVGDSRVFDIDVDDITPLGREDYCGACGQIGCGHDGR